MTTFMTTVLLSIWTSTFRGISMRKIRLFISAFGSPRSAGSAYQKRPTKHEHSRRSVCYITAPLTDSEFEKRLRTLRPRNI